MNPTNFKAPFINFTYKDFVALGPAMPSDGGMAPFTVAKFIKWFELQTGTVPTAQDYAGYLAQWAAEWNAMYPDTPVPPAA